MQDQAQWVKFQQHALAFHQHLWFKHPGLSGVPLSPCGMASLMEEGTPSDSSKAGSVGSDTLRKDKSGLTACDPYLGVGASGQSTSSPVLGEGLGATAAPRYLAAPLTGVTARRKQVSTGSSVPLLDLEEGPAWATASLAKAPVGAMVGEPAKSGDAEMWRHFQSREVVWEN
uniref:Uncharacterized protein n=1 Tax=Sphaerodactylus townsendi TaxID=933632 RepID=A0ACB8ENB1_9SAUR